MGDYILNWFSSNHSRRYGVWLCIITGNAAFMPILPRRYYISETTAMKTNN